MNFSMLRKGAYFLAGLLLTPGLMAMNSNGCAPGTPSAESYNWNYKAEATQLLQRMQVQAMQVRDQIDDVRSMTRSGDWIDWRSHADILSQVRDGVNRMGEEICQLQSMRRTVLPWQKRAINRIQPAIIELANYTGKALALTRGEENANFSSPDYTTDLIVMFQESDRITRTAGDLIQFAKAQQDLRQLGRG